MPLGLGKDTTCGQANPFIELRVYSRRMIIIPERSIEEIAAAMKSVRRGKGMTLRDVETKSGGVWKAVVIGSYERCDRALSIKKAINLANFYQVPLNELLGLGSQSKIPSREKITLDIRATSNSDSQENDVKSLRNFATLICAKRQDWNGEVLSLRQSDLETIAILFDEPISEVLNWLEDERVLLKKREG